MWEKRVVLRKTWMARAFAIRQRSSRLPCYVSKSGLCARRPAQIAVSSNALGSAPLPVLGRFRLSLRFLP